MMINFVALRCPLFQVLAAHSEEISVKMASNEILYNDVRTLMEGPDEATPTLQALKTRLAELEDKYGHLTNAKPVDSKSSEESNIKESNIEEDAQLESAQLDNGYETVDLTAYSNDHLDGNIETDHTATVDHVISDIDHMTSEEASTDTHVTSDKDPQADFPLAFNLSSNQTEPTLDSTLIPSDQADSTLIPDDLGDSLASSSLTSLTQVVNNDDTISTSKETSRSNSRRSSTISAFPEEAGSVLYSRSQSQTIPSRVAPRTEVSMEGTPEYGTSVLSSSLVGGRVSISEPHSFENRLSFEPEGVDIETRVQKRPPPDFANRVAAALSSCSPDDDDVVVAVPVRSNSGR